MKISWGAKTPTERGLLCDHPEKNYTGSLLGCYGVYDGISQLKDQQEVNNSNKVVTDPFNIIRENKKWSTDMGICFLDPWGWMPNNLSEDTQKSNITISITDSVLTIPEIVKEVEEG